jgi:hypothetical protein
MTTFNVPTRSEVSENNQVIFDNLNKAIGFVPNLYAAFAYSDTALGNYLHNITSVPIDFPIAAEL